MSTFFSPDIKISKIYYSLKGYTKPGKYCYKHRNTYELGFRISGDTLSTAQGKSFNVTKGCIVFKPKGVEDVCQTESGVEFCSVCFDIADSPKYDFHVFKPKNSEKLLECFISLNKEERKHGVSLKCYALLYEILHLLNSTEEYLSSKNRSTLEKAVDYVEQNFQDCDFGVDNILSYLNISATQLRNLFHSKYGKSPMQYLIEKRINFAKILLLYSENNIETISELCGFNSPFYFSKIFKKYVGVAPLYFRQENQ
jgi:AraC-like DNA-binding protein